jgi:hypothetical protein
MGAGGAAGRRLEGHNRIFSLEGLGHFQKNCSHAEGKRGAAVLFGFGFVFAQSQAPEGMFLRSSPAKIQNSSLPHGYSFSSNAQKLPIYRLRMNRK